MVHSKAKKIPCFMRLTERGNMAGNTISLGSGEMPFYRSTGRGKNGQEAVGLPTRFLLQPVCQPLS